ncbi:MAG: hypothetical protein IPP81_16080 [Chitinophagaceae bacterium]|nr:hypothetical protein [Chitinophagaceae bacterium]
MPKLTNRRALKNLRDLYHASTITIKYDLLSSADVIIQSMYIGYTEINLRKDQDPADKNHFISKDDYQGIYRPEGLKVTVLAGGMAGSLWELKISVKAAGDPAFKNLITYPIKVSADGHGHLDIAEFFKY